MNVANLRTDRLSLFQSAAVHATLARSGLTAKRRCSAARAGAGRRVTGSGRAACSACLDEGGRRAQLLVCSCSPRSDPAVEMMDAMHALGHRGLLHVYVLCTGYCWAERWLMHSFPRSP